MAHQRKKGTWALSIVLVLSMLIALGAITTVAQEGDTTPPVVEITKPAACTNSPSEIAGTATDEQSEVTSVLVSLHDDTTGLFWTGTGWSSAETRLEAVLGPEGPENTWSWSLDVSAVPFVNGRSYTATAYAYSAGGEGSAPATFTIDNSAPTVAITTELHEWEIDVDTLAGTVADTGCSGTLEVMVSLKNVTANRWWKGGNDWVGTPQWVTATVDDSTHTWSLTMPDLLNGVRYQVQVKATDGAGNSATTDVAEFRIDSAEPTAQINVPADGTYMGSIAEMPDTFSGTASDALSGVKVVDLSLQKEGGNYWNPATGMWDSPSAVWFAATGTTSWSYDASGVDWGTASQTFVLTARATDNVGNIGTATSTFGPDTTAPTVSIDDLVFDCAGIEMFILASDDQSGIVTVAVQIAGGEWLPANGETSPYTVTVPIDEQAEYPYAVRAVNGAGLETIVEGEFYFDTCPAVAITAPEDGSFFATNAVTVTGTASDTPPGTVQKVQVKVNTQAWVDATDTSGVGSWATWSYKLTGTPLAEGKYTVVAQALDELGPSRGVLTDSVSFIVDRTAPTVTIGYVGADEFRGTAGDPPAEPGIEVSGIDVVSILLTDITGETPLYWSGSGWDGTEDSWLPASWNATAGTWSFDTAGIGFTHTHEYEVSAKAVDKAGNESGPDSDEFTYIAPTAFDLAAGWNLMSIPLIPEDESIETVLSEALGVDVDELDTVVDWVDTFVWVGDELVEKKYDPPVLSLSQMTTGQGYWVKMLEPKEWVSTGLFQPAPPSVPRSYALHAGWNLIGYHATSAERLDPEGMDPQLTVGDYLGPELSASARAIYSFADGTYQLVRKTDTVQIGKGYWLALQEGGTLWAKKPR